MCGTKNDINAQSCSYCGYLFEDFSTPGVSTPTSSKPTSSSRDQPEQPPMNINTVPPVTSTLDSTPTSSSQTPASLSGSPLFVVSKSLLSLLAPSIGYLVFIALFAAVSGSVLYSIGLIAVLLLVSIVPVLFSPREFEFYDSSLRMHKIIGGDSEIPYSDLSLYDSPKGQRRPRIVLSVAGQGRPIVIPGNPTNKELGQDLNQFLSQKVKMRSEKGGGQEKSPEGSASPSQDTDPSMNVTKDYADGNSPN